MVIVCCGSLDSCGFGTVGIQGFLLEGFRVEGLGFRVAKGEGVLGSGLCGSGFGFCSSRCGLLLAAVDMWWSQRSLN